MQLGRSKPWPEALEAVTGQRELSATALRDYFQPLEDWLRRENQQNKYTIGWKADANGQNHAFQIMLNIYSRTFTSLCVLFTSFTS